MVRHKTVRRHFRSLHRRTLPRGNPARSMASPLKSSLRAQAFFWVYGLLPAPAGGAEFLSDEPAPCSNRQPCACRAACRHNFCDTSLAKSRVDSAHLHRGSRHGVALCPRSQYHSTRHWARNSGHFGLVGVSGCVASRHARGAGLLSLPSAMRGGTYRFKWP